MSFTFSLIIPTLNRADLLPLCLKSIIELNFDRNLFEIIIVDNGSTDDTKKTVEEIIKTSPLNFNYYYEPEPGLLSGRHLGAKMAKGSIFVFLDDDVILSPEYLNALFQTFKNYDAKLVGGKCLPKYLIEPPEWVNELWHKEGEKESCGFLSLINQGEEEKECDPYDVWGLNFSIRKEIFYELEGFNPDNISKKYQKYQGDGESGLARKLIEKKYKAFYNPIACVEHIIPANRLTLEYVYNRAYYQGVCNSYTQLRNHQTNSNDSDKQKVPLSFLTKLKLIYYELFIKPKTSLKKPKTKIETIIDKGINDGICFHKESVKNDPHLLQWVLKENYLDYKLPI